MNYQETFTSFQDNADPEAAKKMSAYMRGQFPFLGIPTPKRKILSGELYKSAARETAADWTFVNRCWKKAPREFQYLALGYLAVLNDQLSPEDIPRLKNLIITKSWWDTIDGLDRIVGRIALRFPRLNSTLRTWSLDKNIWLRRVAIDHQLGRKEQTDTRLLEQIIINNFGQEEFFINKAIGWSLREYSKTNPRWVKNFLTRHQARLSPLSLREAGKRLPDTLRFQ
ncbi:MAG: DNA alkylation repair protein [Treponema sp.]|jgi:3-methyladenine DNA glycosylase AlkD|nr:DNA alkylation repair protein [Treponema sp.]